MNSLNKKNNNEEMAARRRTNLLPLLLFQLLHLPLPHRILQAGGEEKQHFNGREKSAVLR